MFESLFIRISRQPAVWGTLFFVAGFLVLLLPFFVGPDTDPVKRDALYAISSRVAVPLLLSCWLGWQLSRRGKQYSFFACFAFMWLILNIAGLLFLNIVG